MFLPFCFRFSFFSNFFEYFLRNCFCLSASCLGSSVVIVLATSWIVPVNIATACSMCSGVFNGIEVYFAFNYFFESLPFGGFIA